MTAALASILADTSLDLNETMVRIAALLGDAPAWDDSARTIPMAELAAAIETAQDRALTAWRAVAADPVSGRALRARARTLISLLAGDAGPRLALVGEASELLPLALAVAWLSGRCFVTDPGAADIVIGAGDPAVLHALAPDQAGIWLGTGTVAETLAASPRRAPIWFCEELPRARIDLWATLLPASGPAPGGLTELRPLCIVNADLERVGPGITGAIAIDRGDRGPPMRTGRRGRRTAEGLLVPEPWATGDVRIGSIAVRTGDIAAGLRSAHVEAHVIAKDRPDGARELVAFRSGTGPDRGIAPPMPESAAARLSIVDLPAIPRIGDGLPDEAFLAGLPVFDARADHPLLASVQVSPEQVRRAAWRFPPRHPGARVPLPNAGAPRRPQSRSAPVALPGAPLSYLRGPSPADAPTPPVTLVELLERAAASARDDDIVFHSGTGEDAIGYAELAARARRAAGVLQRHGVVSGDRVVLHLDDAQDMILWFWAAQYAAAAVTPVGVSGDLAQDADAIGRLAERLACRLVLSRTLPDLSGVALLRPPSQPDAPYRPAAAAPDVLALILATSGSTGEPKLVGQTHGALAAQGRASGEAAGLGPDDVSLNWMPLDHVGGLVMFHLRDVQAGCRQVQAARDYVLADPLRWLGLIDRYRATVSWAPNFAYALVADRDARAAGQDWRLASLRYLINGGEAVIPAVMRRFIAVTRPYGLNAAAITPAWGMSETCSLVLQNASADAGSFSADGPVSVGRPIQGVEIRVVDQAGHCLPQGEDGRLQVRGPMVTAGYLGGDGADDPAPDGWFDTGDRARVVADEVYITGREKDVLIVNGRNISCLELESALLDVAEVESAHTVVTAVRRAEDATELPVIAFVPGPGVPPAAAAEKLCGRLRARFQVDVGAIALDPDHIPRTRIGKPERQKLRRRLESGALGEVRPFSGGGADALLPAWFFRPTTQRARPLGAGRPRRRWAVFAGAAQASAFEAAAREAGAEAATLDPNAAHLSPAFGSEPFDALLIWPDSRDEHRLDLAVGALLALLPLEPAAMVLVVDERPWAADPVAAARGALQGLLASLRHERPTTTVRWLTLAAGQPPDVCARIAVEESGMASGAWLAGRDGPFRLIHGLAPDRFLEDRASAVRPGGRYVVTGAGGGLGGLVSGWLAEAWGAEVIGIGRTDPAPPAPVSKMIAADVARPGALGEALADLGPIDGIFHLAGTFAFASLADFDGERHAELTKAKVEGSLACVEALRAAAGPKPPLLVMFGSVNSFFGGSGAASHSTGCAAQAALAEKLAEDADIAAYYLGWSQWPDIGLSRANPVAALAERRGFLPVDRRRGLASLARALTGPPGVVFIGLDARGELVQSFVPGRPGTPVLEVELSAGDAPPPRRLLDRFGTSFEARFSAIAGPARQTEGEARVIAVVQSVWRDVLGDTAVDLDANFFEMGGTSLKLMQAKGQLEAKLARTIQVADILRCATIRQLAAWLAAEDAPVRFEDTAASARDRGARRLERRKSRSRGSA